MAAKKSPVIGGIDYGVFVPPGRLATYVDSVRPGGSCGLEEAYVKCRVSSCGEDFETRVDMRSRVATVLEGRVGLLTENSRGNRFGFMASEIWCRFSDGRAVRVKSGSLGPGKIDGWPSLEERTPECVARTGTEPKRYPV